MDVLPAPTRLVFSLTTTAKRIRFIRPTIDALIERVRRYRRAGGDPLEATRMLEYEKSVVCETWIEQPPPADSNASRWLPDVRSSSAPALTLPSDHRLPPR